MSEQIQTLNELLEGGKRRKRRGSKKSKKQDGGKRRKSRGSKKSKHSKRR